MAWCLFISPYVPLIYAYLLCSRIDMPRLNCNITKTLRCSLQVCKPCTCHVRMSLVKTDWAKLPTCLRVSSSPRVLPHHPSITALVRKKILRVQHPYLQYHLLLKSPAPSPVIKLQSFKLLRAANLLRQKPIAFRPHEPRPTYHSAHQHATCPA